MKLFVSLSRNLLDDVKSHCAEIAAGQNDPAIAKWIKSTFKNWVQNYAPAQDVEKLDASAPEWAKTAFAKKDLQQVKWGEVEEISARLIDYLRHLKAASEPFERMSVPYAITKSEKWHESLKTAKTVSDVEDGTKVVLELAQGYYWVEVTGMQSLDREGKIMGHCVGSYCNEVSEGHKQIYSLRDSKNQPHVTVEVEGKDIMQIKGKTNDEVIPKYRPFVYPFFGFQAWETIRLDQSGISKSLTMKYLEDNNLLRFLPSKATKQGVKLRLSIGELTFRKALRKDEVGPLPYVVAKGESYHSNRIVTYKGEPYDLGFNLNLDLLPSEIPKLSGGDKIKLYSSKPLNDLGIFFRGLDSDVLKYLATKYKVKTEGDFTLVTPDLSPLALRNILGDDADSFLIRNSTGKPFVSLLGKVIVRTMGNVTSIEDDALKSLLLVLEGYDMGRLPKSLQSRIFAVSRPVSDVKESRKSGVNYTNLPPKLASAIKMYAASTVADLAAKSAALDAAADLKSGARAAKLSTSGYLYD